MTAQKKEEACNVIFFYIIEDANKNYKNYTLTLEFHSANFNRVLNSRSSYDNNKPN